MRRPQQFHVIIIHWTCRHISGDPSPHEGTLGAFSILCSTLMPQVRSPRSLTTVFVVYVVKQFSLIAHNSRIIVGFILRYMCTHLISINPIILISMIAYARYASKSLQKIIVR